ncbi:MAG: CidA/LrgA family protein, partial [Betaproteobacteria bacterium]|nr:CidA/LrgA family protein [Betaproteobacteria bacterium]
MINGLLQLLVFQVLGELASKLLVPSVPGPVMGLMLLLGCLIGLGSIPPKLREVAGA